MASEGDRIYVGKIVVGTDPNEELTKNDWAIVVGKSLLKWILRTIVDIKQLVKRLARDHKSVCVKRVHSQQIWRRNH